MAPEFICEPVTPVGGAFDHAGMSRGEPGLPAAFTWRDSTFHVAAVLETWKTTGPCRHGSGEQYVRKHYFRVRTTDARTLTLFFERRPRSPRHPTRRWWLYTIDSPPPETDDPGPV